MGMVKSYFWVLHLLLISAGSYFVADMANLAIGSKLEASIEVPKQPTTTVRASLKGEGGSDYSSIIEGNIFNSKLRGKKVEAPTTAQPLPAASSVPLNVNLLGTVVGSEGISFAIIEDGKTKEQLLYALGDFLAEDAKIIQISRNKVTLLRGNEKETLEFSLVPEENKGAPRLLPFPVSQAASGAGIRQISKNRWVLDRREIEGAVDNLPQLLTKARIIPNFSDGKPDGFRIFAISEESLFAKIGLQNGDVLHRVNGIEVKDPQNFLKVFQQLKDETSVTVDLARNNQKETFSYEIR
ncbi:MAG TPA: type II secretion system protein GspC [Candidatus Manganitrophaceae bacterium]|nr:type II secretion system protein GspC [Candidatus Manganitrophaceae bacterium]